VGLQCNVFQFVRLLRAYLGHHVRQQAPRRHEQRIRLIHFLQLTCSKDHDPIVVHYGVQSVRNGQHCALFKLISYGLLNDGVSSEVGTYGAGRETQE